MQNKKKGKPIKKGKSQNKKHKPNNGKHSKNGISFPIQHLPTGDPR